MIFGFGLCCSFSEGPNRFSGVETVNNNTQPKILEVEELTKMQYLQKIAEAEAEAEEEEEEKEIDLVHLKYRSPDHLPTKLSYKQIQEF